MADYTSKLTEEARSVLLEKLKQRFEENMHRHEGLKWEGIQQKLELDPQKCFALSEMERTGGEPDVLCYVPERSTYLFMDFVAESPKGRRSVCYDREALESRKKYKPETSAVDLVREMGVTLLTENQYRQLQEKEHVDQKTSSWLDTPADIRSRGGALFGDRRYGHVFTYHNGADSYYAARGFRTALEV
ncbi:DUF4256 domain-containing protein [Bacillus daqingensis]|uniref:DUF4256 domain-containing protein n=1 Tax=Bacillus daqingensis TaxID=872396 RepID=A0ABV9NRG7_9BACI